MLIMVLLLCKFSAEITEFFFRSQMQTKKTVGE